MKKFNIEVLVGFFLLLGFLSIAYLSINLGKIQMFGQTGYNVYAKFEKTGGIKKGAAVEIGGVEIGKVNGVSLDPETYQAVLSLQINSDIKLQEDAIASIKTKGLLGEKYVQISPGASETLIKDKERLRETESAVDIEELISKYAFGDM